MRALALLAVLAGCGDNVHEPDRILVFTRTLGHRHQETIDAGMRVLPPRLALDGIELEQTEDPAAFTAGNLARFRGVLFMSATGNDLLDAAGEAAFEAYVRGGGAYIGTHASTDSGYTWPFYQQLLAAHYNGHPIHQPATLHVEDATHPTTRMLPEPWLVDYDEWYNFAPNPRDTPGVRVLVTIDEATYTGGTMGADHPMAWCHENFAGRMFYTSLFHSYWRWDEQVYVEHVAAGIRWAIRRE